MATRAQTRPSRVCDRMLLRAVLSEEWTDADNLQEVSRAFQVLSDPDKKSKYDKFGGDPESRFSGASASGASPFSGFASQRAPRGGGGGMFDEEISPEELFRQFFGGGGGGAFGGPFGGFGEYTLLG